MIRYYVHDFLIGNPILLDTHEKAFTIYGCNIHGQIFDLKSANREVVSSQKIVGLIRRLSKRGYDYRNNLVIDRYIYTYFLTDDQRAECLHKLDLWKTDTLIAETNSLHDAVKAMCEWVYENKYCWPAEDKEKERERLLQYCAVYLNRLQAS